MLQISQNNVIKGLKGILKFSHLSMQTPLAIGGSSGTLVVLVPHSGGSVLEEHFVHFTT